MDFTLLHYGETVKEYRESGYKLGLMKELLKANSDLDQKYLFLRHDVDLSLEAAYNMANYEYSLGIVSSYFILLHSPLYNTFSPHSIRLLRAIKNHGHEICYQVDTRYCKNISDEMKILSDLSETHVSTYAPHFVTDNPPISRTMLGRYDFAVESNAMNFTHMNNVPDFHYLSESGKHWREGCFCEHIDKYRCLQVLIHPEWWIYENNRMDVVNQCMEQEVSLIYNEGSKWKLILQNYINRFEKQPVNEEEVLDIRLQEPGENEDLCRPSL